jgi:hypothetical protein
MLSEDVSTIENFIPQSYLFGERCAWERIKKWIEEARATDSQQPQSKICPKCGGRLIYSTIRDVYQCQFDLTCRWTGKLSDLQ